MKYIIAITLPLLATAAHAQTFCDSRTNLVTELNSKYAESQSSYGITRSGKQMLELFTSASGSWTILLTRPDGTSCAMATGHSWTSEKQKSHE